MLNAPPETPSGPHSGWSEAKTHAALSSASPDAPPKFPGPHGLSAGWPPRGRGWHGGTGEALGRHGGDTGDAPGRWHSIGPRRE